MSKLTRRQFGAGIAAAAIASRAGGSPAWAQNAPTGAAALAALEVTRRLPRRYAGQTIKILSGNEDVSCATCHMPSFFTGDGRLARCGNHHAAIAFGRDEPCFRNRGHDAAAGGIRRGQRQQPPDRGV
jgi:hypothetical protein